MPTLPLKPFFNAAVQIVKNGIYFIIVYIAAGISFGLHGNKLQDFAYRFSAYPVDVEIEQRGFIKEFITCPLIIYQCPEIKSCFSKCRKVIEDVCR